MVRRRGDAAVAPEEVATPPRRKGKRPRAAKTCAEEAPQDLSEPSKKVRRQRGLPAGEAPADPPSPQPERPRRAKRAQAAAAEVQASQGASSVKDGSADVKAARAKGSGKDQAYKGIDYPAECEVFVRPVPTDATEDDLRGFIRGDSGYHIRRVKLLKGTSGMQLGFVALGTEEEARRCAAERNGASLLGCALAVSLARNPRAEGGGAGAKEPCMFFKEGKCTRGDSCKFSHEEGTKDAGRSLPPCQFWAEGRCSRGAACRFSHALGDQREDGGEEAAEAGEPIDLRHDPSVALQTLHEDDDLLAICKPAGVNSHPSSAQESGGTVAHALVGRVPPGMMRQRADQSEKDSLIPRAIMHRLDRGTTGVMLVAKTPLAERGLSSLLRAKNAIGGAEEHGRPRKVYAAVLLGHPGDDSGASEISATEPIGRDPQDSRRMAVVAGGKSASSTIRVHAHDEAHGVSLATVELHTGRMHQIRVHCAHRGAPVAGDEAYGEADANAAFRRSLRVRTAQRPLLHAWALDVLHPRSGERLRLRAPLPQDMCAVVSRLWPELPADPAAWPLAGRAGVREASGRRKAVKGRRSGSAGELDQMRRLLEEV